MYCIDEPLIENAVRNVVLAASRSSISCGVFVSTPAEVGWFVDMGMRPFIVESDQSLLLHGWTSVVENANSSKSAGSGNQ